jgi:hypothetical protein
MAFVLTWQRCHTNVANDVQEIITLFNENIPRLPPGHDALKFAQIGITQLVFSQSIGDNSLDRLVESFNFCRANLNLNRTPPGPEYRPAALYVLASLLRERYNRIGHEESLKEAVCAPRKRITCANLRNSSLSATPTTGRRANSYRL